MPGIFYGLGDFLFGSGGGGDGGGGGGGRGGGGVFSGSFGFIAGVSIGVSLVLYTLELCFRCREGRFRLCTPACERSLRSWLEWAIEHLPMPYRRPVTSDDVPLRTPKPWRRDVGDRMWEVESPTPGNRWVRGDGRSSLL